MLSISEYKILVTQELKRQFETYKATSTSSDPIFLELIEKMDSFIARGGKRLRPYLLYVGYKGAGGTEDSKILSIAAALEFLHNFLLIHDDIIDQDIIRYGGENIDGVYRGVFSELGASEAKRNAINVALLAGDIGHILSSRAVTNADIAAPLKIEALKVIQEKTMSVAEGELVDVVISLGLKDIVVDEDRILTMYAHKTASYTFELPLRLGMLLALGTEQKTQEVITISEAMGKAFQVKDDLLGVFGDTQETGKSDDSDIREGKRTILYAKALAMMPASEKNRFLTLYGRRDASKEEIAEVRTLLETYGVRKAVEEMSDHYCSTAQSLVSSLEFTEEATEILKKLISSLQCRTS